MTTQPRQLITLGADGRPARPRRRDASRNRERILEAAERVFALQGHDATMEEIAVAAEVGKGTLYRNFASRADLARALLDTRSRRIQAEALRIASPAGGRPPVARLRAFLDGLLGFTIDNLDLLCVAAEDPSALNREIGAYVWQRQVVVVLLTEIARERPDLDADYVADALLNLVDPALLAHQIRAVGLTPDRISAGLGELVEAALR